MATMSFQTGWLRFALPALALAGTAPAFASQVLEGSRIRVHYDDIGVWNHRGSGAGLQVFHEGRWVDYSYPGTPFTAWRLGWDDGGSAPEEYFASSSVPDMLGRVLAEEDLSIEGMNVSRYVYQTGAVRLQKTEAWAADGSAMLMHFYVVNEDSRTLRDMRLLYALDPDQDYGSTVETINAAMDIDVNGIADVAISVGPTSGHTILFAPCGLDRGDDVGHYAGWPGAHTVDVVLSDYEGAQADAAMAVRLRPRRSAALAPGDTAVMTFLVVFGDTASQAYEVLGDNFGLCSSCDVDADGWLAPACGGSDCDDTDPDARPDGVEVFYDGVDGDCDGASDYDADLDGHDSDAHGGDDCDDADPAINPSAADVPYDGIDSDCSGGSDLDADGDGADSGGHGGDDCNDADASIFPGADDVAGDGVDSDCDGTDGPAGGELIEGGCGCASAPVSAGWLALGVLGLVVGRRRRR
jgi:MYXO-CTERM domain-containing protein